jgi:hypothetical protein
VWAQSVGDLVATETDVSNGAPASAFHHFLTEPVPSIDVRHDAARLSRYWLRSPICPVSRSFGNSMGRKTCHTAFLGASRLSLMGAPTLRKMLALHYRNM